MDVVGEERAPETQFGSNTSASAWPSFRKAPEA